MSKSDTRNSTSLSNSIEYFSSANTEQNVPFVHMDIAICNCHFIFQIEKIDELNAVRWANQYYGIHHQLSSWFFLLFFFFRNFVFVSHHSRLLSMNKTHSVHLEMLPQIDKHWISYTKNMRSTESDTHSRTNELVRQNNWNLLCAHAVGSFEFHRAENAHGEWTSKPIVTATHPNIHKKWCKEIQHREKEMGSTTRPNSKTMYCTYIYSQNANCIFRLLRNDKLYINLNLLIFMLNVVILIRLTDTALPLSLSLFFFFFFFYFCVCVLSSSSLFSSVHRIFTTVVSYYYLLFQKKSEAIGHCWLATVVLTVASVFVHRTLAQFNMIQFKIESPNKTKYKKKNENWESTTQKQKGCRDRIGMLHKISSMVPLGTEM